MRQILFAIGVATCWCVQAPFVQAQSAENVAVVINDASPTSRRVGEYYATVHALPMANVIRIRTITDETIDRAAYVATIEQPIAAAIRRAGLQDRSPLSGTHQGCAASRRRNGWLERHTCQRRFRAHALVPTARGAIGPRRRQNRQSLLPG